MTYAEYRASIAYLQQQLTLVGNKKLFQGDQLYGKIPCLFGLHRNDAEAVYRQLWDIRQSIINYRFKSRRLPENKSQQRIEKSKATAIQRFGGHAP